MATLQAIETGKAIALGETIELIQGLLEEESERLVSAKHDVMGRSDVHYVMAMLLAELTRVVASQAEKIRVLEAAVQSSSDIVRELSREVEKAKE
jgi:hypothetical protein